MDWMRGLNICAPATRAAICASVESLPTRVTRTSSGPPRFTEPAASSRTGAGASLTLVKPMGYAWSHLACRIGHRVAIRQPSIGSSVHLCEQVVLRHGVGQTWDDSVKAWGHGLAARNRLQNPEGLGVLTRQSVQKRWLPDDPIGQSGLTNEGKDGWPSKKRVGAGPRKFHIEHDHRDARQTVHVDESFVVWGPQLGFRV
jgi:hypothetical protein